MDDKFDEISGLLKNNPPPSHSKMAEDQAVAKAMAAFDKKNASALQGMGWWRRLMGTARMVLNPNDGAFMKKSYMVASGLCAATLTVALLSSTTLRNEFMPPKEVSATRAIAPKPSEAPALPVAAQMPRSANAPQATNGAVMPEGELLEKAKDDRAEVDGAAKPSPMEFGAVLNKLESNKRSAPISDRADGNHDMVAAPAMVAPAPAGRSVAAKASVGALGGAVANFAPPMDAQVQPGYHDEGRDTFEHKESNPLKVTKEEPVSTFSIDVDTASYAFMRSQLNMNVLPQKDAVRIEEMVNYFPYDYAAPKDKAEPFKSTVSVFPTPWNAKTKLIHIGIKGYEIQKAEKPHSNLVFLIDTSGSMDAPNRLPLVKNSLKLLLNDLRPDDSVAIVTYAGSAGTALQPTLVKDKATILASLDNLNSSGSTAGAEGIRQAYTLAKANFDTKGVNRVILATDGDFNVGITDPNELKSFIERERDSGIFLSVLGFGQGNYNDALMQTLAQNGNGNAAYIDTLSEARKVLVEEAGSTLFTIAKDVKLQVEFNPAKVAEYRLVGYETRMLKREDFNNDKVDAGDIGAGHAVTAIYEITPTGSDAKLVDDLRYGAKAETLGKVHGEGNEYAFLKIRYKLPKEDTSKLITTPINSTVEVASIDKASMDARFATTVAGFAQLLRGDAHTTSYSYDDVIAQAQAAKGADEFGYRAEFINLVRLAKSAAQIKAQQGNPSVPMNPTRFD